MIQSVTVVNPKGETLTIELTRPEKAGIAVTKIDGLGPPKATINFNELATTDGGLYTSSRMSARNITVELTMIISDVTPTIEDSRRLSYRYFQIKKPITFRIKTDRVYVEAHGYVESNEPDVFSSLEKTQVSIVCPDPYFYEVGDSRSAMSGVRPLFEFPFSNEDLRIPQIVMGEYLAANRLTFEYDGDVDTGVTLVLHALDTVKDITLYNVSTLGKIHIDTDRLKTLTGSGMVASDDIIISTVIGKKYIKLLRNGRYTNVISIVNRDLEWFQLTKGINTFVFTAEEGQDQLTATFYYKNAYGGV